MPQGISIREFARRAGCDEKVVRRKVQSGHLPAFPDGTLDPAHVDLDWRSGIQASAPDADSAGKPADSADSAAAQETTEEAAARFLLSRGTHLSKAEAERVKENYVALLRELEYDKAVAAVVEVEDVEMAVVGEYALVRNKLLNIGSRVAHRVAVLRTPEEVKAVIDTEIALALEELKLDGQGLSPDERQKALRDRFGKPD